METSQDDSVTSRSGADEKAVADDTNITPEDSAEAPPPRNIILLSDGTGNSAAKAFKTNVWRLYKALDLRSGMQLAHYDDGVGTSGFKPFQILGGAFGWGLSRNVRDLYTSLCRDYQPGDHIYTFGFSRGAFTVRTLAGLILHCGVLDPDREVPDTNIITRRTIMHSIATDHGLRVAVRLAYRSYRRRYPDKTQWAPVVRFARWLRDAVLGPNRSREADAFRKQYARNEMTRIQCIGVWDTVAAVGMPIDELSMILDKFIYPHRFPDQHLSDDVIQARHAVAIDDERQTFHPVLWNENGISRPDQIKQVWFTGMHSDVGGGYADDDLSHVSLVWMIEEVQRKNPHHPGLDFDTDAVRDISRRATLTGPMHDSRRGAGVYYRYKPRRIQNLCNDPNTDVCIPEPRIHISVMKRIAAASDGYAPAGLPDQFTVIDYNASESGFKEDPSAHMQRIALLERAQNHILWRRVLYFLLLLLTVSLLAMPYYAPPIPGMEPEDTAQNILAGIFDRLSVFLPTFAEYWTDTWAQNPRRFLFLTAGLLIVLWHRRNIAANTQRLAEAAWWHCRKYAGKPPDVSAVRFFEALANRFRQSRVAKWLYRAWITWLLPGMFLALLFCFAVFIAFRMLVHYPAVHGGVCSKPGATAVTSPAVEYIDSGTGASSGKTVIHYSPRNHCQDTGLILHAGQPYKVDIEIEDTQSWMDGQYKAGIDGLKHFTDRFTLPFLGGLPARRKLSLPWFTLIAEIGRDSGDVFPMNQTSFTFKPKRTGRLYLYVNDAINSLGLPIDIGTGTPSRAWNAFYLNNKGEAKVTITWQR